MKKNNTQRAQFHYLINTVHATTLSPLAMQCQHARYRVIRDQQKSTAGWKQHIQHVKSETDTYAWSCWFLSIKLYKL